MKKLVLLVLLVVGSLSGCSISNQDNKEYTISFYVDGVIYHTAEIIQNKEIEFPTSPTKNNNAFDGWFFDLNVWNKKLMPDYFMSNELKGDMNVYARFVGNSNENKELGMKIIVNNKEFVAKLYDATAAKELYDILPMTIDMSDMPHEKYFYLSNRFTTDTYYPNNIEVGDIMLYGSNCLVLFYDSFSSSYNYTRIGKIENINGFKGALGRGNVTVRFEKHDVNEKRGESK